MDERTNTMPGFVIGLIVGFIVAFVVFDVFQVYFW